MLLWLTSAALAGHVYVNGVNVDALRDTTFTNVSVTIDAEGNLHIDAPGYTIEVVDPGGTAPPPVPAPSPVAPAPAPVMPAPAPPPPQPITTAPPTGGVASGKWWLLTEDNASVGHTVHVFVNGVKVTVLQSGAEPFILDIGAWLHSGPNTVEIKSNSANAGGGAMYVYLGEGANQSGTIVMDAPSVQFGLGPSRQGPHSRTYQLMVP
ncbi:MAG: hypothetical protein EP330_12080 [Deltaproteobacteria bacterium]|nr:MAG: hypothetical protein EP330_12080 [Deltaproteobacteria bacterium]